MKWQHAYTETKSSMVKVQAQVNIIFIIIATTIMIILSTDCKMKGIDTEDISSSLPDQQQIR